MSSNGFMKRIDNPLFKQLTEFKSSDFYQSIIDSISALDEGIKPVIRYLGFFIVFLIPLGLTFFVAKNHWDFKAEAQTKKDIIQKATQYIDQKKSFGSGLNNLIAEESLGTQSLFNAKVTQAFTSAGARGKSTPATNYSSDEIGENILRVNGVVKFNTLTTDELVKVLENLTRNYKMKVEAISINKDGQENKLNGEFSLVHFGKKS